MVAAGIFVMAALGLYTILIRSYQLNALARYRDDARGVLRTYADQFLRLQTADKDPISGNIFTRKLFMTTSANTGEGFRYWYSTTALGGSLSNEPGNAASFANGTTGVPVTLGGADNGIPAFVFRMVEAVDPGPLSAGPHVTGHASGGGIFPYPTAPTYRAGSLLLGTFTINYHVDGRLYTQSISILRAAP
jgi:hypothetical protein